MRRTRIEMLEARKMFSVTDLIIDPFDSQSAAVHEPSEIVDFVDADDISSAPGAGPECDALPLVGDFNGDGRDDLASSNNLIIVVCSHVPVDGILLPYLEQDNLYLFAGNAGVVGIADGTSNTLSFAKVASFAGPAHSNSLGLHVDTSPIEASLVGVDIWEHAYRVQDGARDYDPESNDSQANGIIAILIGLAAGPSDPSGNTQYAAKFCLADGSVHFIGVDTSSTRDAAKLVSSPEDRSNLSASLLTSEEFFSRFADEDRLSALLRNGEGASGVTHEGEFEKWASMSRWERGYMNLELADVLVSSMRGGRGEIGSTVGSNPVVGSDHAWGSAIQGILHEDNELSFPRMIR
jgi:hypothetical protein